MKFRKLIEFGKSSYVISIPKTWVIKQSLKKGDLLFLTETDEGILVCPKEKTRVKEIRKISICVDNKDMYLLEAELISAYQANFGVIEITGKDLKKHTKNLKATVHNLAGLEIMDQTESKIVIKDLLKLEDLSVAALVRRIDIILRSMIKDSMNSVFEDYYESINTRDFDINRLVFLTRKVLRCAIDDHVVASQLKLNNRILLKTLQIVSYLESLGDEIKRMSRLFKDINPKVPALKELKKLNKLFGQKYFELMRAYHTKNKTAAFEMDRTYRERMKDCNKLLKKGEDRDVLLLVFHMKVFNNVLKNMARTILDYESELDVK